MPPSDFYEAESQWSTKLSGNSFQPSYSPNNLRDSAENPGKGRVNSEHQSDFPEIITAGPEVQDSITVKVSSDDKSVINSEMTASAEVAMMETMDFGKISNTDDTIKKETTTIQTTLSDYQEKKGNSETAMQDSSTESLMKSDFEKASKKIIDPLAVRKV